ncbi:MAG: hypothetical protein ACXWIU_02170 [Limisphaerales bacterium]
MTLITSSKVQRLLYLKMAGKITAEELRRRMGEVRALVEELKPEFRLLSNLEHLDSMDKECLPVIAEMMDLFRARGLAMVVRVIPDTTKDIGLNILAVFHYGRKVRSVNCKTMEEALKALKI